MEHLGRSILLGLVQLSKMNYICTAESYELSYQVISSNSVVNYDHYLNNRGLCSMLKQQSKRGTKHIIYYVIEQFAFFSFRGGEFLNKKPIIYYELRWFIGCTKQDVYNKTRL